jgi:uncharacterized protein (DUF1778 family)
METKVKTLNKARFDAKLSKEQKDFFQYAALASQRDKEIFFHALMHPDKPNEKLQKAAKRYKEAITKK